MGGTADYPEGSHVPVTRTPLAHFLTFHTYGTWLHGDVRTSVDRNHNMPDSPRLPRSDARREAEEALRKGDAVVLSSVERRIVARAIQDVCDHRGWTLHTMNVRTNHVHIVVTANESPERVMNAFKSWATRAVRALGPERAETRLWTRHGSTRYLWDREGLEGAIHYVRDLQ